jgi:signal peptidase I
VPRTRSHRLLVVAAIAAVALAWWFVRPYRIPTPSMVPTFRPGDQVLAARVYAFADPERGDLVVFHPNGKGNRVFQSNTVSSETYVKRLVGLPGESIGSHNGRVYVCREGIEPPQAGGPDSTAGCRYLAEPYVHGQATGPCGSPGGDFGPILLRPSSYYLLGDNRIGSEDSRCFGQVSRDQFMGEVFLLYWPLGRIGVP